MELMELAMSAETIEISLEKIRSANLRQDASFSDSQSHTVIVEIDLPGPTFEASNRPALTEGRPMLRAIAPSASETEAAVSAARNAVQKVLGRAPERYLPTAHAFIVDATGAELRKLAASPSIAAIWPNTMT